MPRALARPLEDPSGELLARLLGSRDFTLAAVRRVCGLYLDACLATDEDAAARAALDRAVAAFLGDAYAALCDGRWCAGPEGRDGPRPAVWIGRRARSLRMKITLREDLTLLRETRDRDAVAGWMSLLQRRDDALADALRAALSDATVQDVALMANAVDVPGE